MNNSVELHYPTSLALFTGISHHGSAPIWLQAENLWKMQPVEMAGGYLSFDTGVLQTHSPFDFSV